MAASVSSVLYTVASESVGISRRTAACSSSALGWLSVAASRRKIARRWGVAAIPAARQRSTNGSIGGGGRPGPAAERGTGKNYLPGKKFEQKPRAPPPAPPLP